MAVNADTWAGKARDPEGTAVRLLQLFSVCLFLVPSNQVFMPIGASGYLASLVGIACFAIWGLSSLLGFQTPRVRRSPVRIALWVLWLVTMVSYLLSVRYAQLGEIQLSADRWLLLLIMVTGVVLVASEGLHTMASFTRVVRVFVIAAAACAFVGLVQFVLHLDLAQYLRMIPGLSENGEASTFSARSGLTRVAGTGLSPIEFGVVCGMVLPLSVWLALGDTEAGMLKRWGPSALLFGGVVASVSRSAIISVAVAVGVFIALLPAKERAVAFIVSPVALIGVFMSVPGFIGTISVFFLGASTDPSVTTRLDDYDMVAKLVASDPWLGHGPGFYTFSNMLLILDNQYFMAAINFGLIGVIALLWYFLAPAGAAMSTRSRTTDASVRILCGAIAGAALAGAICSYTFDSMSFPLFVGTQAMFAGLSGALWVMERATAREWVETVQVQVQVASPALPISSVPTSAETGLACLVAASTGAGIGSLR